MGSSRRSPFLALLASVALAAGGAWGLVDAHRQASWKPVPAKTGFSRGVSNQSFLDFLEFLDRRGRGTRRTHAVQVEYSYKVGDKEYKGSYLTGRYTQEESWQEASARGGGGEAITVYVDPADPARSTKDRASYGVSLVLALLGVGGLAGALLYPAYEATRDE